MMSPYLKFRMANAGRGAFRAEGQTIWLYDMIAFDDDEAEWLGGVAPRAFIEQLQAIDGPVTLRINSPGGSVWGAQAMVAAMREHPYAITARVDALAASAASVVAAEAARCEMARGSEMMIHKAWGVVVGNCDDMGAAQQQLAKIDRTIAETYAARSETDADAFEKMMAAETWFSAQEACDIGLCDAVLGDTTQRAAAARWDMSAFQSAPWCPAEEATGKIEVPAQDAVEPDGRAADDANTEDMPEPSGDPVAQRAARLRAHDLRVRGI